MTYFVATTLVVLLVRGIDETIFGNGSTSLPSTTSAAAVASVECNIVLGLQINTFNDINFTLIRPVISKGPAVEIH